MCSKTWSVGTVYSLALDASEPDSGLESNLLAFKDALGPQFSFENVFRYAFYYMVIFFTIWYAYLPFLANKKEWLKIAHKSYLRFKEPHFPEGFLFSSIFGTLKKLTILKTYFHRN